MKKIFALMCMVVMTMALSACSTPEEEQPEEQISYEIAMVTDSGVIMDGGYSEAIWNAISSFGMDEGISHKYYKAAAATDESYMAAIDSAVQNGARVILADGYSFENVVYDAQTRYEDVKFILMDAEPTEAESGQISIGSNTMSIMFASEQAGYLAGYAAVKDGMNSLGFIGEAKKPDIINYEYGFIQGAEAAAAEDEALARIDIRSYYCVSEDDRESILQKASQWYGKGTQAIFACGSEVEMPVIEAAELADKKVIAYETDKSAMSDTVITSASKNIEEAIKEALDSYDSDDFEGGAVVLYDASNDGIWLEMDNSKFERLTKTACNKILKGIAKGDIEVAAYDIGGIEGLKLEKVNVIL